LGLQNYRSTPVNRRNYRWSAIIMGSIGHLRHKIIFCLVISTIATDVPGWSNPATPNLPLYSESFCLKVFEETAEKARSSTWQISDRDRHILTQCRAKFPTVVDPTIALPKATQCLDVVKTLVRDGTKKLKELELPDEQVRSLSRCDEVLAYYSIASDTMQPTLQPQDRIVVDRTSYQTQTPQRGDIVAVKLAAPTAAGTATAPLTNRIIGLPGETVKIVEGKVYIDDRPIPENYIVASSKQQFAPKLVPAGSYFILGDNRNNATIPSSTEFVTREAIVGKVIWHFGSK
jgi:signal peptidase I